MKAGKIRERMPILIAAFWLMEAFLAWPVYSKEPSTEPILRIETGMHTAKIGRIGTDEENRYLVTGSHDKTVRVWELPTGKLLRILRPPIGEAKEGMIYAVALSPDGKTVACGGRMTGSEEEEVIYLFDRATGILIKRIAGLPNVIYHLAYSKDKDRRFFAATLAGANGIRVFDARSFEPVPVERDDYGGDSYGADFDNTGRLVTASYDGYVRLYRYEGKTFKLLKKEKPRGESHPYSVKFSPDRARIAVGFDDSTKVDVLSSSDLSYLYSPDTSKVKRDISSVAWSSDGRFLYAGGRYWKDGCPIIKWSEGGRGSPSELKAADSTIMHILPLKSGGIVFGAYDPAFGLINDRDERVLFKGPSIADYRGAYEGFLVSKSGSVLQFGYELWGKTSARFSIPDRLLELIDSGSRQSPVELKPPVTSADGLEIDWESTLSPKLNKNLLKLEPNEMSYSVAIAPDRKTFLLGTAWYLRLYDRGGKEKWEKPVPLPGLAWAVNISGDGRVAVAALADGTIRWYRMEDGEEVLALFPHSDKKRWVIWTPSGYYDASAGAEELIGWHINKGSEKESDFFPVSQFRSVYYRPDVVAKVMETLNEKSALKLADRDGGKRSTEASVTRMLPPVVTILSPQEGAQIATKEVTVKFRLRSPAETPVTRVEGRVNGNFAKAETGLNVTEEERLLRVSLEEKEVNRIAIIAENRHQASEPAFVTVKWTGRVERGDDKRPTLYVLAVGVTNYKDEKLKEGAKYAAKDADDFVRVIMGQKGTIYKDIKTMKLLNKDAAKPADIVRGLEWIERETTSNDVAMIFMAGHGERDLQDRYFFLPSEFEKANLRSTALVHTEIIATVKSTAGKIFLFIDTCYSGSIMARSIPPDLERTINEIISAQKDGVVFASSQGSQRSVSVEGNGAFTKALIEGLQGTAVEPGTNNITIGALGRYIASRVKELTQGQQHPPMPTPFKGDSLGEGYPLAWKTIGK
jgi:WD40 repeat protein